jgi:diguanylate cyclase (GGDEF)-like protein/putative nucleotidyltransferase with HDIG domain
MKDFSLKAKLYIISMIVVGMLLMFWQLASLNVQSPWLLVLAAAVAAITQVFKVEGATENSSYNVAWTIYGLTLLLMGAPAAMFVILVAHLVEWVRHKYPWYIQIFNIASYALAISMAGLIYNWINPGMESLTLIGTVGILAALAVFTLVNHLTIGAVIWLVQGLSFAESGVFNILTLMIDFTLMGLGAAMGIVWLVNPYAAILTVIPLYLIYRVLKVPSLQRQTEIDPKTKLYNARYFNEVLEKELERAQRFDRPMTVVMGDLDLLRNINNTYGHLAGDVVLCGIADLLREEFQAYNIVARFGGEEFAILMPETTLEEAFPRIETVREAIASTEFEVSTSVTPIKATMSFGIAGRDKHVQTENEIIHNADVALYSAKLNGRNETRIFSSEGIDALFGINESQVAGQAEIPKKAGREAHNYPHQPNPLREELSEKSPKPGISRPTVRTPGLDWMVNVFVGVVAIVAVGLVTLLFRWNPELYWIGLAAFAVLVAMTEGLSIEFYISKSSISTSTAPFLAGVLLYGPVGALVLSVVLATTAMIKNRSPLKRYIFNTSNHLISSSLCAGLILLTGVPFIAQPVFVQISLAVLCGLIMFVSSTMLLSCVVSLSMGDIVRKIWKQQYRWLWPFYAAFGVLGYTLVQGYVFAGLLGMLAIVVPLLLLRYNQVLYIQRTEIMVSQLRETNLELEMQSNENTTLNEELLLALANLIDLRDPYVYGHSEHVATYASLIAEELGLTGERVELIRKAGLLHDIGKFGVPESILLKPSRLTAEEYCVIEQHPAIGGEMVEKIHSLQPLVPMIRYHHERYNGKGGYPDGLQGEDIPLEARIICLADAIEAMASDRPYRRAMENQEIFIEIRKNTGTQFDPKVVDAFFNVINKRGENLIVNSSHEVFVPRRTAEAQIVKKELPPQRFFEYT